MVEVVIPEDGVDTPLNEGDYVLAEDRAWIKVGDASVRLMKREDGTVSVLVFPKGCEDLEQATGELEVTQEELDDERSKHWSSENGAAAPRI